MEVDVCDLTVSKNETVGQFDQMVLLMMELLLPGCIIFFTHNKGRTSSSIIRKYEYGTSFELSIVEQYTTWAVP